MRMQWIFKQQKDLETRKLESASIIDRFPGRIPVIVQKAPRSNVPSIDRTKFLVPPDITVAQLMWIIRKRVHIAPEKAIFIFVDKVMPQSSAIMSQLYDEHMDEDGFLYIMYSGESTFGGSQMC